MTARPTVLLPTLLFAFALGLAGCADDSDPPAVTSTPSDAQQTHAVTMSGVSFQGGSITVSAGDTVVWRHDDGSIPHTVETRPGAPASFDSGDMGEGDTYSFTFTKTGSYDYFCKYHPGSMQATITVI